MPPPDPVRLAIVGAGRMGATHLRALAPAPSVRVVAVVDPLPAVRNAARDAGLRAYADNEELLAAGQFDAVLIAAPSDLHLSLVRTFAANGFPILCEKPLGLSPEDAAQAAAAAVEASVLLQVGFWRRFVPELVKLRERLAAGELGTLSLVSCSQWDAAPPHAGFRRRSGGILLDMGVHEFDQIRWLTGAEVEDVHAVAARETSLIGDPETVLAVARLSSGSVATISLGRRFVHGDCCWIELIGTDGHDRSLFMWGREGEAVFLAALTAQAEGFAAGVRDGVLRGAGGDDALHALAAGARATASLAVETATSV